jgi:hypothetical protein
MHTSLHWAFGTYSEANFSFKAAVSMLLCSFWIVIYFWDKMKGFRCQQEGISFMVIFNLDGSQSTPCSDRVSVHLDGLADMSITPIRTLNKFGFDETPV